MITKELEKVIQKAAQTSLGAPCERIELVNPDPRFGDFALACHPLAQDFKLPPQEIAGRLAQELKNAGGLVADATAVNGYLNITVSAAALAQTVIKEIIQNDKNYGAAKANPKETVLIEYSSPNTNKPLHLGHIRNNVLGMALARLLQNQGHEVKKVQVINDRGIHIIKSMLAYQKWGQGKTPDEAGEKGDHFVGRFYVRFEQEFAAEWSAWLKSHEDILSLPAGEQDRRRQEFFGQSKIGAEAQVMLRAWEAGEKGVRALWQKMNSWVYEGFAETYQELGSEFDKDYYESDTYVLGKKIVEQGVRDGIFQKEDDGSITGDLSDAGLDKKILQRRDGTAVYITQDLGLAVERAREWKFDRSLYVVGHEQEYHFKVLFAVFKKLGYDWAEKLYHLSYGLVFLPEGKMKSREGRVVDADDIMAEVEELARQEVKKRTPEILEADLHARAAAIGLGALKFFLLRVTPTQAIHFNPAEAIAFEGSTGPYVQYAHARIAGILAQETPLPPEQIDFTKLSTPEEKVLLLKLRQYPQVLTQAAEHYGPNLVCDYLLALAHAFNSFYHEHRVLRAPDEETKEARLLLVKAVQIVLRSGLGILGIRAIDKM